MFTKRRLSSTLQKRSTDKLSFNVEDFKSTPKNTPISVQFQVRKVPKDFVEQSTPLLTSQLYNWQFYARQGAPKWVTHSCPPYKNNISQLFNLVSKDAINRYKLMRGYHVHFMSGFSSYGTHVEAAIEKEGVIARRNACRDLVKTQTIEHMQSLDKWGILADYRYSYFTMQPSYEANVLERFADMQSRKLIERGQRPVYYSVEQQKILSEEELQVSVDLRDSIVTKAEILSFGGNQKVAENYPNAKVLLWTEDCWKLEGANGVTFNPTISYLLVKHNSDYLILAEKRLGEFIARVGNGKSDSFKTLLVLSGQSLQGMTISNPLNSVEMPLVPDVTLKPNFGSGLHTVSPAHNIHDLKLSYMHSLAREGVLSSKTGLITRGLFVGTKPGDPKILTSLQKQDFYFASWKHQNPSFQTSGGEPVYLLSIDGWFFKISDQLKYKCFGELQKVKFVPDLNLKSSEQTHKDLEKAKRGEQVDSYYLNVLEELNDFSEWCISEEGSWGIPVPYFERIGTGEVLSSAEITRHVANVIRQHGGSDAWYNLPIQDLLPTRHKSDADQYQKGQQIFDVWFDTSLTWDFALR